MTELTENSGRDIFIVCNDVQGLGGVQRFAHILGALLASRGHRVRLVGIAPEEPYPYDTSWAAGVHVVHRVRPPGRVYGGHWWRRWRPNALVGAARHRLWIRRGARELSRLFAAARPGGIVIVAQVWAMEWVAAADCAGMPVIGMSHESYAASRASTRRDRVKRYYADVERLLCLTQEDADAWANDGMSNVGAMPNPLTVPIGEPSPLTEKVVVALGRLSYEKGFDLLVEAWAKVAAQHPDWTVRVYGTGPEEMALRAQIEAAGLDGRVELMGQTDDVPRALREASALAMPSRAEGWPLVLGEAMATGVPCVAFDCAPGIREILSDGEDGIVVAPGNVTGFAEALGRLIADEETRRRMGAQALVSVQRFSPDAVADRWEREFTNLFR
jgi:glycosyltransferase involved in cell wall biosynthesis